MTIYINLSHLSAWNRSSPV